MTATAAALAVGFWSYCGALALLARSDRGWTQNGAVLALSSALYFALASGVAAAFIRTGHPLVTVPGFVLVLLFGTLLGQPWLAVLIGECFDRARRIATGEASMTVEKTYDRPRKAEREGEIDLALRLYGEAAAADPGDPEPLRRMAELQGERGRLDEALALLERASGLAAGSELRAALAFRRADLLERAGRRGEAAALIESVDRELPGTSVARCARERLEALRRPLP